MNYPIPSQVFEATHGLLVMCFAAMTYFAVRHLHEVWRGFRASMKLGRVDSVRMLYWNNKPDIAHTIFSFALLIRFMLLWHVRHVTGHNLPETWFTREAQLLFLLSNGLLVLAGVCWCRNVSPYRIKNWIWVTSIAVALAASIWLAS